MAQGKLLGLLALAWGVAGCGGVTATPAVPHPSGSAAWSPGAVVAEAAHLDAPAIGLAGEGWAVAWADGPDLYLRQVAPDGTPGSARNLELETRTSWNLTLLPAPDGGWHLLWRDLDAFGQVRLFSARLLADGALSRGPFAVTPEAVSAVAVAPGEGGTVVIVWADATPRPALFGRHLDSSGRPGPTTAEPVVIDGGWPALARMGDGSWLLAWLTGPGAARSTSTSRTAMVRITDGALPWEGQARPVTLAEIAPDRATEYVETVRLGLDQRYGYLFVSHRDATTGLPRTEALVFSLAEAAAAADSPPLAAVSEVRLPAAPPDSPADLITGFNTGPAFTIPPEGTGGDLPVGWPAPAWGQFEIVPVALAAHGEAAIGYFQEGWLAGYQPISLGGRAAGALGLWTDRARHLSLAWANRPADGNGPAALLLTSTRPRLREALSQGAP